MVVGTLFGFVLELILKESIRGVGAGTIGWLQGKCPVFEACVQCPACVCPDINYYVLSVALAVALLTSTVAFGLGFCCGQCRVKSAPEAPRKVPRIRDDRALFNASVVRE
jgi:hypothetical protein